MKSLGIDHGDARIGVAVSDPLGLVARPLETIHRKSCPKPEERVRDLANAVGAGSVVVGLPLRLDGSEGAAVAKVRAFAAKLRACLPSAVSVVFCDERFSTVEALGHLRRGGKSPRARKAVIDETAATVILQDWLDQQAGPPDLPPD